MRNEIKLDETHSLVYGTDIISGRFLEVYEKGVEGSKRIILLEHVTVEQIVDMADGYGYDLSDELGGEFSGSGCGGGCETCQRLDV